MQYAYILIRILSVLFFAISFLTACSGKPANYPHGKYNSKDNIFFSSFSQQPKTLDPAVSYSSDESVFVAQVVEPPLQYAYLKRPYELEPLVSVSMPHVTYLNNSFKPLSSDTPIDKAAYTVYRIQIKPNIFYQPHPAFAKNENGQYYYLNLSKQELKKFHQLKDFKYTGTRELTADDFVYEIKRLASPNVSSPIAGLMSEYILDFDKFSETLQQQTSSNHFLDLRHYSFAGVKVIDRYTYEITIKGVFQQFPFWLATSFFGPIPWEVDKFYSNPALQKNNITFATYPVGTGAYMITDNNPNSEIILKRNPNFHHETYPMVGEPGDKEAGYLNDAGKSLPFIDMFVFTLEKESIPRWSKFLQGYYDTSGIAADNFDQAVQIDIKGKPVLTQELKEKNIRLRSMTLPSIWYFAFNMRDPIVGGNSVAHRKLRQAIAIAVDTQEYISIFLNGRGKVAYSPIPPGIEGFASGKNAINSNIAVWNDEGAKPKSLAYAKQLLAEAGYPNGVNAKTGKPLILRYDAVSGLGSDERAQFQWMQEEFAKLGIQLVINDTDYNRFQEKARAGNLQIFAWGWGADYPDPENFLFTLYGPNSREKSGGENATNYENPTFDRLFLQMKNMPNGPQRDLITQQMVKIFQNDTPWFGILYAESYQLAQSWTVPRKINGMANNTLKYSKIYPLKRAELQVKWNKAHYGYLLVLLVLIILSFIPFLMKYWRMQRQPPKKIDFK
jgi:ABC-type transport system substrate-binding protein